VKHERGIGMKKQLKHIVVNINDLKPAAYNPREELHPGDSEYENIKNSIQEFGYADAMWSSTPCPSWA